MAVHYMALFFNSQNGVMRTPGDPNLYHNSSLGHHYSLAQFLTIA